MIQEHRFSASHQITGTSALLDAAYNGRVLERGFQFMKKESWATEISDLKQGFDGQALGYMDMGWSKELMYKTPKDALCHLTLSNGNLTALVAGDDEASVDIAIANIKEQCPLTDLSDPNNVLITFWALGQHGPFSVNRKISVPTWDDIEPNYATPVANEITRLSKDFKPAHGGQLLLWHGEPGTGKTYALRALAREWKNWCDIHYVVDPEKFFGLDAAYLVQVLMGEDTYVDEEEDDKESQRWRLLIFEDTGELISADAAARSGQGLSRFLNVVDGLIGQGLRILLLVTTNEELDKLHPAVARPGRCASNVKFTSLDSERALAFLRRAGLNVPGTRPATLAELYQQVEHFSATVKGEDRQIGFVPRVSA